MWVFFGDRRTDNAARIFSTKRRRNRGATSANSWTSTKSVVASIVEAGKKNRQLPKAGTPGPKAPFRQRKTIDRLLLPRGRVPAAAKLPAGSSCTRLSACARNRDGFVPDLMRNNFVTRTFWTKVGASEDVKLPPGRAGRTNRSGPARSLPAFRGVGGADGDARCRRTPRAPAFSKEILDSRDGGSGFSFNDLSADLAGVAFAKQLLQRPQQLRRIPETFKVADYTIAPMYEPEGLPAKDFAKLYGSISDERFLSRVSEIRKKLAMQPGLKPLPEEKP